MWGIAQHQVSERQALFAASTLGSLYLCYKLVVQMSKKGMTLDTQGLHRPKSTLPILGNTLDVMFFQRDRLQDWFAEQSQLSEGKPWVLTIVGQPQALVITSPEVCEDVYKTQGKNFGRGDDLREVQYDIFGNGLANANGDEWLKQRRIANHMFSLKMLRDVIDTVIIDKSVKLRDVLAQCAKEGRVVPMNSLMGKFSTDVLTKMGFGVDLHGVDGFINSEVDHPFLKAVDGYGEVFAARLQSPMWFWKLKRFLNLGDERMLKWCIKVASDLLNDIVLQSMTVKTTEDWKTKADLLTLFMKHTGKTDISSFRDFLMNFLLIGKETTSFSLAWVIVHFNRHPHVLAKLRAQIRENLPELMTGKLQAPTVEDLEKIPYLKAVVRESLRLRMTATYCTTMRPTTLCEGTFLPIGSSIIMSMYAAGRLKNVWGEDAAEFNPDRWIDGDSGKLKSISPFQFITFGIGSHRCVGMNFALLQMETVLAVLFSRFDIKTVEDPFKITYQPSITLPVKGPLECTVHELSAPAF